MALASSLALRRDLGMRAKRHPAKVMKPWHLCCPCKDVAKPFRSSSRRPPTVHPPPFLCTKAFRGNMEADHQVTERWFSAQEVRDQSVGRLWYGPRSRGGNKGRRATTENVRLGHLSLTALVVEGGSGANALLHLRDRCTLAGQTRRAGFLFQHRHTPELQVSHAPHLHRSTETAAHRAQATAVLSCFSE